MMTTQSIWGSGMLKRLQAMVDDLTSTNSNNEKIERLKKYDDLKQIIHYTYNPFLKFNVTSKTIEKHPEVSGDWAGATEEMIIPLLNNLASRQISGHAALAAVGGFIDGHAEYKDLIYSIIDKNLKIRMSDSTINKVFPGLIPEFKCQLADKFDIDKVPDFENDKWLASRKLDGVRCLTIVKDKGNDIKCNSRTGNEFQTLFNIQGAIKREMAHINTISEEYVLDGEVCIIDEDGNEDFASIMRVINKKNYTIENPRYKIFDIIPLKDFLAKSGQAKFSSRNYALSFIESPSGILSHVQQVHIENIDKFNELSAQADELGWEGLIIRKDVPYAGKRSKNMLKVKKFHEDEYEVLGIEIGKVRYISKVTGLETEADMISSLVIEHKGNKVNVGSGLTLDQRMEWWVEPPLIVGKIINVKYFEESKDMKTGKPSLRFPILKYVYGDKREV